jgi:hypothetical protein
MADLEIPQPEKKQEKPSIQKGKITVDEFLITKPPMGETSRQAFRIKSIGCNDLEKLYKEFIK